jgi:uncharacterized glyoxalase superfamily protein PhnB
MDDTPVGPTLTPSVHYGDAVRALRWLTEVIGFRIVSRYDAPDGSVAFAELVWRTGVVFVSSRPSGSNPWSRIGPASIALVAEDKADVDRHYSRAIRAGAEVVRPVHDAFTPAFPEGSHQFDLRDPEGNLWTIGTFQPRIDR